MQFRIPFVQTPAFYTFQGREHASEITVLTKDDVEMKVQLTCQVHCTEENFKEYGLIDPPDFVGENDFMVRIVPLISAQATTKAFAKLTLKEILQNDKRAALFASAEHQVRALGNEFKLSVDKVWFPNIEVNINDTRKTELQLLEVRSASTPPTPLPLPLSACCVHTTPLATHY
jgi:hypothetical protein